MGTAHRSGVRHLRPSWHGPQRRVGIQGVATGIVGPAGGARPTFPLRGRGLSRDSLPIVVIPAQAGIQGVEAPVDAFFPAPDPALAGMTLDWMPAFAGMTLERAASSPAEGRRQAGTPAFHPTNALGARRYEEGDMAATRRRGEPPASGIDAWRSWTAASSTISIRPWGRDAPRWTPARPGL